MRGNWRSAAALFTYAAAFSLAYVHLDAGTGALLLFATLALVMGLTRKLDWYQVMENSPSATAWAAPQPSTSDTSHQPRGERERQRAPQPDEGVSACCVPLNGERPSEVFWGTDVGLRVGGHQSHSPKNELNIDSNVNACAT